jgi:hypothetical protein
MCAAKAATQSGGCDLNWASKTPESGFWYRFQAGTLVIYTGIKIPQNPATRKFSHLKFMTKWAQLFGISTIA